MDSSENLIQFSTEHTIYFSNKEHVPVQEIAESLLALVKILERTPSVLDALLEDASVDRIEVYLDELKSGSLFERAVLKFFFRSQKEFDSFFRTSGKKLGVDVLKKNKKAIPYLFLSAVLIGGVYAIRRGIGDNSGKIIQIQNHADQMIQITAETVNLDPKDLKNILLNNLKDKSDFAKEAVKFVGPATRDKNASITFDSDPRASISSEVIQSFPNEVHESPEPEFVEEYSDVEIQIRAVDLDSVKKGWAAKIPAISENRVKLQLAPFVDCETLMQKKVFRGNVTAIFETKEDGKKIPKLYYLSEFEGQQNAKSDKSDSE